MQVNVLAVALNDLSIRCHVASRNAGWWNEIISNVGLIPSEEDKRHEEYLVNGTFPYVIATKIALIHSELSEALEGVRRNADDDKLPHRKAVEVELADALIRIFDLAGALDLDLGGAVIEKMNFNVARPDHQVEQRRDPNGKIF